MWELITGGLLGACATGVWAIPTYMEQEQKRESVAAAFYVEIKYIIKACKFWKYDVLIQDYIIKAESKTPIPQTIPNSLDINSAFKFYNELATDMTLLSVNTIEKIVLFYANLQAVHGDLTYAYLNWESNRNVYNDEMLTLIYKNLGLYKQAAGRWKATSCRVTSFVKKSRIPTIFRPRGSYVPFGDKILNTKTELLLPLKRSSLISDKSIHIPYGKNKEPSKRL